MLEGFAFVISHARTYLSCKQQQRTNRKQHAQLGVCCGWNVGTATEEGAALVSNSKQRLSKQQQDALQLAARQAVVHQQFLAPQVLHSAEAV